MSDQLKRAFIGVGNEYRKDDGLGLWLVRHLAKKLTVPGLDFYEASGEGARLMSLWQGYDQVTLFDAVMSNGQPGRKTHIIAQQDCLPSDFFKYSSHAFSLAEAVELARVLGRLPNRLEVVGVEGLDFGHGCGLSPPVERSCQELINTVDSGSAQFSFQSV